MTALPKKATGKGWHEKNWTGDTEFENKGNFYVDEMIAKKNKWEQIRYGFV